MKLSSSRERMYIVSITRQWRLAVAFTQTPSHSPGNVSRASALERTALSRSSRPAKITISADIYTHQSSFMKVKASTVCADLDES